MTHPVDPRLALPEAAPTAGAHEGALRRAALAVSRVTGEHAVALLAQELASVLEVGAVIVAVFVDDRRARMRSLACVLNGRRLKPFEYEIAQTPCRGVVGQEFRYVERGVRGEFAPGTLFEVQGFDSYAAYSLNDASGRQLGLIAAMDRKPLGPRALVEPILKIFAVRVEAELDRRRAEEALRASEASYRAIFEASEDPIFVHDWDTGAILDVSPKAEALYGYTREEFTRLRVGDISLGEPPYTDRDAAQRIQQARRSREPVRFEWRARHRDGRLMWQEVTLKRATIAGEPRVLAFVRDVTARKQADEALRASEERYRLLFETESDALHLVDVETLRIVDANQAAEQLWGYSREELLALTVADLSAEPEVSRQSIRTPKGRVHIPLRMHRRKDGTVFPVEITANRLMLDGRLTVVAAARDITERKRAEESLRASEARYRAIFNATADALVLRDADFRVVEVNEAYLEMSGFAREEVIGRDRVVAHPLDVDASLKVLHQRALAGEALQLETRGLRKDGTELFIELRGVLVEHEGRPHVLYMGRDITGRRRAEEAVRASEEQYRAIFNASADALMLWNSRLERVDVNPAHEKMFGFAREDVVGRGFEGTSYPEGMVRPRIEMIRRALAGEPSRAELEALRKDGGRIVTELRSIPFQHRGEPHVLQIARDITERKRAEEERVRLEVQLRQAQKMEALGQLTGGIAHDFNNILTSVMGYLVLAAERPAAALDPKLPGYLEQAQASCRRARDLIQQMLTFSRGRRGEPRLVNLAALVGDASRLLRATLPATVGLEIECGAGVPAVRVDPVQADQVLLNLAINARDAMEGRGAVRIRVGLAERGPAALASYVCASCRKPVEGAFAEVAVTDQGPGIPPAVQERMFEPFYTTKGPGRGTGMGLATVHGIVHEHGGHVIVESEAGAGTTFRVLLPVAEAPAPEADDEGTNTFLPSAGAARLVGRVLLVEDEPIVAGFMHELLAGLGLHVTIAGDPVEAERLFDAEGARFDLVITDQTMPHGTGLDLARRLLARRPQLPVVLYTGYTDALAETEAAAEGLRALVRKPVDPKALRRLIEDILAGAVPA